METRTVQPLGSSTVAVTLPATWVREYDVAKGDEISLRCSSQGMLILISEAARQTAVEAFIHAESATAVAVERAILAQYVLGRRIIQITTREGESLEDTTITAVYNAESQLMGLGVIEETSEQITIRCSVNPEDFILTDLLERLEATSRTMRDEAIQALTNDTTDPNLAYRALNRERQANKIFVLLLRLIFTAYQNPALARVLGIDDGITLIGYRSIAKSLELIADNAAEIADLALNTSDYGLNVDDTTLQRIRTFTEMVHEITEKSIRCAITREYDLALNVRRQFTEIEAQETEILTTIDELPNEDFLHIREVLVYLRQTAQEAIRNAEIGTNLALNAESDYITIP